MDHAGFSIEAAPGEAAPGKGPIAPTISLLSSRGR
jgi:hypothetical protein